MTLRKSMTSEVNNTTISSYYFRTSESDVIPDHRPCSFEILVARRKAIVRNLDMNRLVPIWYITSWACISICLFNALCRVAITENADQKENTSLNCRREDYNFLDM